MQQPELQNQRNALRAVDAIQVRTYQKIGRHIVEFEQSGATRAEDSKRLLPRLAESLTSEFGGVFDERNLRNMRAFFQVFPIWNAVRTELNWTHCRTLLSEENEQLFASKYRWVLPTDQASLLSEAKDNKLLF